MTAFALAGWDGRSIVEWDGQLTMVRGQNHCLYSNSNDPCWWDDPCSLNDWQSIAARWWFGSLSRVIISVADIEPITSLSYLGIFGLLSRFIITLTKTLLMMSLITRSPHYIIVNGDFAKYCQFAILDLFSTVHITRSPLFYLTTHPPDIYLSLITSDRLAFVMAWCRTRPPPLLILSDLSVTSYPVSLTVSILPP